MRTTISLHDLTSWDAYRADATLPRSDLGASVRIPAASSSSADHPYAASSGTGRRAARPRRMAEPYAARPNPVRTDRNNANPDARACKRRGVEGERQQAAARNLVEAHQASSFEKFMALARFDSDPFPYTIYNVKQFEDKRIAEARVCLTPYLFAGYIGGLAQPGERFDDYANRIVDEIAEGKFSRRPEQGPILGYAIQSDIQRYKQDIKRILNRAIQHQPGLTDRQMKALTTSSFCSLLRPVREHGPGDLIDEATMVPGSIETPYDVPSFPPVYSPRPDFGLQPPLPLEFDREPSLPVDIDIEPSRLFGIDVEQYLRDF